MDTKALLVAGDTGVGLALLTDVVHKAKEREENRELGLGDESDGSVISSIDIGSRHREADNVDDPLEDVPTPRLMTPPATPPSEHMHEMHSLIAASVGSGLKLKRSRAMGLAQQKGALGTLLVNGLHGQFEPVVMFVRHMQSQAVQIAAVLDRDAALLRELLSTLSAGLVSRSRTVAAESAILVAGIGNALSDASRAGGSWRWLTERAAAKDVEGSMLPPVGLQAILASVEIRSGMNDSVFAVLKALCRGPEAWSDLMAKHMPARLSPNAHMDFMRTHMVALSAPAILGEQGVVEHIAQHALLYTSASSPSASRSRALRLMGKLCIQLPDAVDVHPSAGRQTLSALKRACRDQSPRMQILAHVQLYEMLDNFLQRRHTLAPLLYKTLIFSLIENHQSEFVRQFVAHNMAQLMRRHQDLPVGVLIEPLLRQVAMHGYNNLDFDFFVFLARHSRLEVRHVLQLLDLINGLCVVDALHGRLASIPYLVILDRFHEEPLVADAVERHGAGALNIFMQLESKSETPDTIVHKTLVLEFLAKVSNLGRSQLCKPLLKQARQASQNTLAHKGHLHPGLRVILSQLESTIVPTPPPTAPAPKEEEPALYKRDAVPPANEDRSDGTSQAESAIPRRRGGARGRGGARARQLREEIEDADEDQLEGPRGKKRASPKRPARGANSENGGGRGRGGRGRGREGGRGRAPALDGEEDGEEIRAGAPARRKPRAPADKGKKLEIVRDFMDTMLDDVVSGTARRRIKIRHAKKLPRDKDGGRAAPGRAAPGRVAPASDAVPRRRQPRSAQAVNDAPAFKKQPSRGGRPTPQRGPRAVSNPRANSSRVALEKKPSVTELRRKKIEAEKKAKNTAQVLSTLPAPKSNSQT